MKKILLFSLSAVLFLSLSTQAQEREYPLIKEYGAIFEVPEAQVRPDAEMDYKIVIDISNATKGAENINFSLDRVARAVNLHNGGGVPPENMDMKVIAYASGVNMMLSDEAYNKRYGHDNPNTPLIESLHEAGVTMMVCGQSIRYQDIDASELHPHTLVTTSYITALTTFQLKGFVLLHF